MGFKDLCTMAYKYPDQEAAQDPYKKLINKYAEEDETHWKMYLSDLKKLGVDSEMSFTRTLNMLWGDSFCQQRWAIYHLMRLARNAEEPLLRFVLVECAEKFGEVFFRRTDELVEKLKDKKGIDLAYFGAHHLDLEMNHATHQDEGIAIQLLNTVLTEKMKKKALQIADEGCSLFEGMFIEWGRNTQREWETIKNAVF